MESKPNYLLVGSFVVGSVGIFFATMIWLVRADFDVDYSEYEILISGTVSGLSVAGDVRFNGITVGQVKSIGIYEGNSQLVQVIVAIDDNVPITVDSVARLEIQGLTGVSFIEISSGMDSEPLERADNQEYRRIRSEPSTMQDLLVEFPAALGEVRRAAEQMKVMLNSENQELLTKLLTNLVTITGDVAAISSATADNFHRASGLFADASANAEQLFETASEFSVGTLPEFSSLIIDLRRLTSVLTGVAIDLDQNATEVIFGTKFPEYQPE